MRRPVSRVLWPDRANPVGLTAIPLGLGLPPRLKPPTRKLGRAGLRGCHQRCLFVLLRMEVASFHPPTSCV